MKHFYPIFLTLLFSSLFILSSCKDKKVPEKKAETAVEVKKEAPKKVEPIKEVTPAPAPEPIVKKIIVKEGEWLCNISRREYGNLGGWQRIYEANKAIIDNPDLIFPNQELIIPE